MSWKFNPFTGSLDYYESPSGTSDPAGDTVVSETAFGQSATAGTNSIYSRSDHTHGTPENPSKYTSVAVEPSADATLGIFYLLNDGSIKSLRFKYPNDETAVVIDERLI